jgi:hypothetical protein
MKRILAFGIAMLAVSTAQALTYSTYTDRTAFEAAISDEVTEDFNAEVTGEFDTREFDGFTVTNLDPGSTDPNNGIWTRIEPGTHPANINGTNFLAMEAIPERLEAMSVDFDVPIGAIGFDWRNTDFSGDDARMVIVVDGEEFVFGTAGGSGFFGVVADEGAFGTVIFGDTIGGGTRLEDLGLDDITFTAADPSTTARFKVTKEFTNGDTGDVEVTLTCNGGIPLEQSFTISGGGPGVTFTVTNLPDTGADCEITESGGPDGYTNNADACSWTGVTSGLRTCAITNTPEPSEFAVEIDFDTIEDPAIDLDWDLEVVCTAAADAEDATTFPGVTFNESGTGSDDFLFTFYADPDDGTDCTATLSGLSSAIEQDGACTIEGIAVGEADDPDTTGSETPTCTITATAFYEGIPTLSQYGLALMALLMLGVGFIGFRRFA